MVETLSIPKTNKAIIKEAMATTIALLVNSSQVGHDTLVINSEYDSLMYKLTLFMMLKFARVERLELPANGFGDRYSTN